MRGPWIPFLVLGALGALAVAAEEEPSIADLRGRLAAARAGGDRATALATARELTYRTQLDHAAALFDMALEHAAAGRDERAWHWLGLALDSGFSDAQRIGGEPALERLRGDPRLAELRRQARIRLYLAMLEREERDDFQRPDEVMRVLALRPGERVADVGAGSGYFTLRVARAVGAQGVVWAIDIRREMLDHIAARLDSEPYPNVRLQLVDPDDPQLPAGRVDTVLMVDTLHYVEDRTGYARKLRAALAPGGRVVIIDYRPKSFEERPWGPAPEQQLSRETLDRDFAAAGLVPLRAHEFLPEQYFVEYGAR